MNRALQFVLASLGVAIFAFVMVGLLVNFGEKPTTYDYIVKKDLPTFGGESAVMPPIKDEILEVSMDKNPWRSVRDVLESHEDIDLPLIDVVKKVCLDSGIAVTDPEWGLHEGIDHKQLPKGFILKINMTKLRAMTQHHNGISMPSTLHTPSLM